MARVFYRVVQTNPPSLGDFASYQAQGKVPHRPTPEVLRVWQGVSVFATEDQAKEQARLFPTLGAYVAVVEVDDTGPIRWERTTARRGHHTLWGELADLLARVVSIVPM